MEKTIYQLELHETLVVETIDVANNQESTSVIRVPGGWIYKTIKLTFRGSPLQTVTYQNVFVPFNDEFLETN